MLAINRAEICGWIYGPTRFHVVGRNKNNAVCRGCVVMHRKHLAEGETTKSATYVDIEAWGELAHKLQKWGTPKTMVYVTGFLKQVRWIEGDGRKRSRLVLHVAKFQTVDGKGAGEAPPRRRFSESEGEDPPPEGTLPELDLPTM